VEAHWVGSREQTDARRRGGDVRASPFVPRTRVMTRPSSSRFSLPVMKSTSVVQYSWPDAGGRREARRSLSETRSARALTLALVGMSAGSGGSATVPSSIGAGHVTCGQVGAGRRHKDEKWCILVLDDEPPSRLSVGSNDDGSSRRTCSAQIGMGELSCPLQLPREDDLFLFHGPQVEVSIPSRRPAT
jgi:hypothetical protein